MVTTAILTSGGAQHSTSLANWAAADGSGEGMGDDPDRPEAGEERLLIHWMDTPLVGVNTRAQSATGNRRFTDARHPLPTVSHGDLALERECAGHQARRPIGQAKHNRKRR